MVSSRRQPTWSSIEPKCSPRRHMLLSARRKPPQDHSSIWRRATLTSSSHCSFSANFRRAGTSLTTTTTLGSTRRHSSPLVTTRHRRRISSSGRRRQAGRRFCRSWPFAARIFEAAERPLGRHALGAYFRLLPSEGAPPRTTRRLRSTSRCSMHSLQVLTSAGKALGGFCRPQIVQVFAVVGGPRNPAFGPDAAADGSPGPATAGATVECPAGFRCLYEACIVESSPQAMQAAAGARGASQRAQLSGKLRRLSDFRFLRRFGTVRAPRRPGLSRRRSG